MLGIEISSPLLDNKQIEGIMMLITWYAYYMFFILFQIMITILTKLLQNYLIILI